MRLDEETNREFDENKRCQACTLVICDEIIYSCMQCDDFILHQTCAHLPRKKQHATHSHLLTLQVLDRPVFECTTCDRRSNGFMYACCEKDCRFRLDVRCASIAEPLDHCCHPHPMFLTSDPNTTTDKCSVCGMSQNRRLNCGEGDFVLCFKCATLPDKVRYKHDEHYLIFSYDGDAYCRYLCDVCEEHADPRMGIYRCSVCSTTLHITCLLGDYEEMYMLPGRIKYDDENITTNINILSNNHLTRNICSRCKYRCTKLLVYKISDREVLCSFGCLAELMYNWF
ncbi:uncharacterized protein LOC112089017 [Eutrema salsugineum]|uniref:uncharacterized protein LOC112089017 n=1 Tax=Eutrema salsugineum TaxID=72664 RepID=UPI000CED18FA|nr:uncharacterized protein LOC112089017 [Eutrema salsugineum]